MHKLHDYVEMAAAEYWREKGKEELEPLWLAEYYQDCGVMDDHPEQSVVGFFELVQKALTRNIERAEKVARLKKPKGER